MIVLRIVQWIVWTLWYLLQPQPPALPSYLMKLERTRPPWWTFKPYVWHNPDGQQWEIYFKDESTYNVPKVIKVSACISYETGEICGFVIHDEELDYNAERPKGK